MRWTKTLIPTLREAPKDVEAMSHRLMLRAGYIRKLGSGIYSYLPLGMRVLQNVSRILREEMNAAGALEVLLPALHPAELWKRTGRYEALGADKVSFKNRSGQEFVLGPTHEEVITELASGYLKSYQDFPKIFYQIQTKFRDELRPRFGIIRTKEFIMKDAYSFDLDRSGLDASYQLMVGAYQRIFKRVGLTVDIVSADPGVMGGDVSHEFMARSPYGEDRIVTCAGCAEVVSRDIAVRKLSSAAPQSSSQKMEPFETPNVRTIDELSVRFELKPEQMVKTILYIAEERPVAACVRGDHQVHEGKLRKHLSASQIRQARPDEIQQWTGAPVGFTGPAGLKNVRIVIDGDIARMSDFVAGANQAGTHFRNVNLGRDFKADSVADIRFVEEGDRCAQCGGKLTLLTAMEVGHVFKLGTRYTEPLEAKYRSQDGKDYPAIMGCYGIGVNRIVAALVEEHSDAKGMCWPLSVAPYQVHLITVNQNHEASRRLAEELEEELGNAGISCLFDDRSERAGVKFNDADLIGSPAQVIVSERNLAQRQLEVKMRRDQTSVLISQVAFLTKIQALLAARPTP